MNSIPRQGNALKELGDLKGAIEFYLKALKLKPRFGDAYNNLASAYMQIGQTQQAIDTFYMVGIFFFSSIPILSIFHP